MSQIGTLHNEIYEDDFEYEDYESQEENSAPSISNIGWTSVNGKSRLFCFYCNRPESHYNAIKHRWYYWILNGMTFGLIRYVGPYRCRCCGHRRLFNFNRYHPKFIYRKWQAEKANQRDRKRY